jgi:hypothetical protein
MAKANKNRSYHRAADKPAALTPVEYSGLQDAYDHFNAALFEQSLPDVFITYQRKANSHGYFSPDRFSGRVEKVGRHELALNPDAFIGQTDEQILQTLVHEMTHVWQHHCGTPAARSYHNKEWSANMKSIGLMPSSTGMVGGKDTGACMSDYIIPGGAFSQAYEELAANGWRLNLQSAPRQGPKSTPNSKTKFTCATCGQNAWGKPDLDINCRPCGIRMRAAQAVAAAIRSYAPKRPSSVKRGRGRPKGSKNKKPKAAPVAAIQSYSQEPTKWKRGRPPGSKNKKRAATAQQLITEATP